MASEAHLHAWEQRLRDWQAELEARERRLQEREAILQRLRDWQAELEARERRLQEGEAILQDDETTLQDALSPLEEAEAAGDGEEPTLEDAALASLEEAEAAGGGEALGEARTLLLEGTCAKSAAHALMTIADVANNCDNDGALLAINAAERAVRDAFVLRLRSEALPGNRASFLETAEEAFGRPLDRDARATLLQAYHKVSKGKPDTFPSNSQLETARRGRPRPRRRKQRDPRDVGVVPAGPAPHGAVMIRIIQNNNNDNNDNKNNNDNDNNNIKTT